MLATAPSAPSQPDSLGAPGLHAPAIRRSAGVITSLMAGGVGWVLAYWRWQTVRGIRWGGIEVDWDLYLMPWWVPPAIVGAVAMLLWPILAAHARRTSLRGGSGAMALV